ncbi:hypothetical protein VB780_05225 [Leptolyngbya sp. CCNP1308]|uniref:hypothetical protein n=1 Tax=Leptolyngbya sp. CCNP1308 TaxID=3110255 RepID=UPI002B1F64CA|nr:hypothetical protein [Leptolyngbya sp. CCNP1308]MEA5447960.1 hypothetical protein [Leptolyngbya sp. CCNP1308]
MKRQEFSVNAHYDEANEVVEVVIRCSPNLIRAGMDIARMQVVEVVPEEGPIAAPLEPAPSLPPKQHSSELDAFIDSEWQERSSGPVLPNVRGF